MNRSVIAVAALAVLVIAILGIALPLSHYERESRDSASGYADIGSVFADHASVVLIVPTQEADKAAEARIRAGAEGMRDQMYKGRPVITDSAALQQDLSSNSLVVLGTPSGNAWLAHYLDQLPVRIEKDRVIADKEYPGSDYQVILAWRNPQNPQKSVLIHTAQRAEDFVGVPLPFRGPISYVIARGPKPLSAGNYWRNGSSWSFKRPATFSPMQVVLPVLVLIAGSIVWWLARGARPEVGMPDESRLWPTAHAFVFLFICLISTNVLIPLLNASGLQGAWPWHTLAPLAAYFALVGGVPSLRKSLGWLRVGRLSAATIGATVLAAVAFSAVLLGTDRAQYTRVIGSGGVSFLGMGVVFTVVVFALLNATMEEFVFRGIVFDALKTLWGAGCAIVISALTFGLIHYATGCPCGVSGICIVAVGGLVLGGLRFWSGGIVLPILAHAAGDATIFYMAMHAKGV